MTDAPTPAAPRRWLGLLLLLFAVAFGTWARVHTALADPEFDARDPVGMLKSDPGLLYYVTERIVESGGWFPDDFRADPRVLYPLETDLPARFTVGQEVLVAWAFLAARGLGSELPLHVIATIAMALAASLTAVGVFGLALELTRRPGLAGLAAVLFACLPASYRTIGLVLMREDFSFPFLVAHLWLATRAVRLGSPAAIALAAAAAGAAAATWHASAFFLSLEAACVLAWFLRTGANPLGGRHAWIFPAVLIAFGLVVPVLSANAFALSPPVLTVYALWAAAAWSRRRTRSTGVDAGRLGTASVVAGTLAAGVLASLAFSRGTGRGLGESSHVFGLVLAKVRHLGRLPEDPAQLSSEVRLMWQGPFETLDLASWSEPALYALGAVALALGAWTVRLLRTPGGRAGARDPREGPLVLLATLSLPVAWLIARTSILPAALLPVAAAVAAARARRGGPALGLACAFMGCLIPGFLARHRIAWYQPPQRQAEIARMIEALPRHVPPGAAVAADFVSSTAVLAHTRRPILLQPKYEDRPSRERAEGFLAALFEGTPEDLRRWLERHECRYLLLDRFTLWFVGRYAAGVPRSATAPAPGTAAALLLMEQGPALETVPGFRLLYRSPQDLVLEEGGPPTDFYRLFELEERR